MIDKENMENGLLYIKKWLNESRDPDSPVVVGGGRILVSETN